MHAFVTALPWIVSTPVIGAAELSWPGMLTWAGVIVTVLVLLLSGRLIPKSTHEREIGILKEQIVTLSHLMEKRVGEANERAEANRGWALAEQSVSTEERTQKRMLLDANQANVYALNEIRAGLERIGKDTVQ